ncbi:MAG: hypothetical protein LBG83_04945 [Oscillospiraceae bacterium]|jgi:hypothetical protein|nr:hypothetical protein [Oscillospiraceae bacterium]
MGQYYTALVIEEDNTIKKLDPHKFDSFYKIWEHAWIGNHCVNAAYALIHNKPCKVAWIGDYSKSLYEADGDASKAAREPQLHDIMPGLAEAAGIKPKHRKVCPAWMKMMPYKQFQKLYDIAWGEAKSMRASDFTKEQLTLVRLDTKGTYLVNHDLKCYLNMADYICGSVKENGMCFNPLPILTACGNGLGNGDYEGQSCSDDVGTWAFHRLEYTDRIPEGYSEKKYCFIEDRDTCTISISV